MGLSWPWITGFAILSFTANVVFLIGCMSPSTHILCLWRVDVALLADSLQNIALLDGGNETKLLLSPELPTYWYWGMSGICDVFETTGEKRCRRAFPPINNLLGLLEDSLAERLDDDEEQLANILSSWDATLNNISPNRLAAKEAKFAAQLKASAALVILAIVLDFGTPLLALCLKGRHRYILPFVSSSIVFAAGALAAVSMSDGIHGVVETSEHGGPAIIILFVGAALRLLSAGGACCSSSRKNNNTGRDSESARADHELAPKPGMGLAGQPETSQARKREIGFRGEDHVNMWLEDELPDWSPIENWTSKLRTAAGHPEFTKNESNYADFTYVDRSQRMVRVLKNAGVPVSPHWSARTTYHLEVKSTTAGPGRNAGPFFVSDNQVARLMKPYEGDPLNAYILIRVFHVEGTPNMKFFRDPWSNHALQWGPLSGEGDYQVYVRA